MGARIKSNAAHDHRLVDQGVRPARERATGRKYTPQNNGSI